jgi:hypothetical protein
MKIQALKRIAASIAILSISCLVLVTQFDNGQRVHAQQPAQPPRTAEQAFKNIKVIKSMPAG